MRVLDPWVPFLRNSVPFFSSTQDLRPGLMDAAPSGLSPRILVTASLVTSDISVANLGMI